MRLIALLAILASIAGVAYLARDQISMTIQNVVDELTDSPVVPAGVEATTSAENRGAELTADGATNTSWSSVIPSDGLGQSLLARFDNPFRLVNVIIIPGASEVQQDYLVEGRPSQVRVVSIDTAGDEHAVVAEFEDAPGPKKIYAGVDDVVAVRIEILQVRGPAGSGVAIAEAEYSGRY